MSSFSVPPEEQAKVRAFDPLVLDRTVIAIPLLKDMEADLERISFIKEKFPEVVRQFNSAIEFNLVYPGGQDAAHKLVEEMVDEAAKRALRASEQRLKQVGKDLRPIQE